MPVRIPLELAKAFDATFEDKTARFLSSQGWIENDQALSSNRFLARSILPHLEKLSQLFNRLNEDSKDKKKETKGLDGSYWKSSSHPRNLKLAYFLGFMPPNLVRAAAIWSELHRLGYRWPHPETPLRAIDFGAGPATLMCGLAAAEKFSPVGLPTQGNWALIERDAEVLELGQAWASYYCSEILNRPAWEIRPFRRIIKWDEELLPKAAPRFQLWTQSFALNEGWDDVPLGELARNFLDAWKNHVEPDGLIIWIEPALKVQSRKLLEIRKALIASGEVQVLLPCLGHQTCGAFENPEDWCHEDVTWWRPPYLKKLDQMAGLDRKSLPFSYLVLTRSRKPREEILPGLAGTNAKQTERLVSPSHYEGRDQEFYMCGQSGKRRARIRHEEEFERGDILLDAESRGDPAQVRIESIRKKL